MRYAIETEQEDDGRWLAEAVELPGVMCYGATPEAAVSEVMALADRVVRDRRQHGEYVPNSGSEQH